MDDSVALFVERFYLWAITDFEREIREKYPFLRRIQNRHLHYRVIPFIETLEINDQTSLIKGLIKRFHFELRNMPLQSEPIDDKERQLVEAYLEHCLIPGKGELRFNQQVVEQKIRFAPNKLTFRELILDKLSPILGQPIVPPKKKQYEWDYRTTIGKSCVMFTHIDIGGRYHQLTYMHRIEFSSQPNQNNPQYFPISILSWLGISSQTLWNMLKEDDIEIVSQTLADLCMHFLQATSILLDMD